MEPRILIVGRLQTTLDILAEELEKFGRHVIATNERGKIATVLNDGLADFVAIGAGLPEEQREEIVSFMKSNNAAIPIQVLPWTADASPVKFLHFVNNLAVEFKIQTTSGLKPFSKRIN